MALAEAVRETVTDYAVKDLGLAKFGRAEIGSRRPRCRA